MYYFDSVEGNDRNSGLSQDSPKKSLAAINQIIAEAPYNAESMRIRIKAGSAYEGTLKVVRIPETKDSNTDMAPLVIDVYGATEEQPHAKITGSANAAACVEVNGSNIRISGLEVTGPTAYRGIWLNPTKAGAMKNVVISGNYCHDINFNTSGLTDAQYDPSDPPETTLARQICTDDRYSHMFGGIIANAPSSASGANGANWFEGLWIEDNIVERVSRAGIWVFSNWTNRPGCDWGDNHYVDDENGYYPHKNVIIRKNKLSQTGGDAIVMGAVRGGWIENNSAYYTQYLGRDGYYNAGIWTHSCKNVVFQFNEAAYTYKRNGAGDGQGFDIDIGNTDITFRYNYSHHNEGGGILFCNFKTSMTFYNLDGTVKETVAQIAPDWSNVEVRNNVFADNGEAAFDIVASGDIRNLIVENNTVVIPGTSDKDLLLDASGYSGTGTDADWMFRNNIFLSKGGKMADFAVDSSVDSGFYSNVFWGFPSDFVSTMTTKHGEAIQRIYVVDPAIDKTQNAQMGLLSMLAYKPGSSEMLSGADVLTEKEPYDAACVKVGNRSYFGAFCTISRK